MTSMSPAAPSPIDPPGGLSRAGDLFQLLRDGRAWTRSELAAVTGLARSTVAARIDALLASGLVGPAGEAVSSGGRPPARFAFNPAGRIVLAVDLGASHAVVALTTLDGTALAERRVLLDIADGPEKVLARIVAEGRALLAESGRAAAEVAGVGIGLPGPVEHATGRPARPPIMPGWDGFDVVGFIREAFPTQVLVDNDVNIMALGERAAFWPGVSDLFFVKLATGVGAGIISGGELLRGANGTAGDFGHIRVARGEGVSCRCGNTGCLEALTSGPAIAKSLAASGITVTSSAELLARTAAGDMRVIQELRQAGRDLGEALAVVVNLLNPSVIVLGGGLAKVGEQLMVGVREVVYARAQPLAASELRIALSMAGDRAAILGAAQLVTHHILSPAAVESHLKPLLT